MGKRTKPTNFTKDQLERWFEYSLDLKSKTMFIGSIPNEESSEPGTDASMAEFAIKGLFVLDRIQPKKPLTIVMNNPGGDEYHGMAIYDAIKSCRSKTRILVSGHAMSMGSIILQAADERLMYPNSRFMIHYGTPIVADADLHALEQQTWSRECEKFRLFMEELYLKQIRRRHPEFTLEKVRQMLSYGTILSPQETVGYGLADRVFKYPRKR